MRSAAPKRLTSRRVFDHFFHRMVSAMEFSSRLLRRRGERPKNDGSAQKRDEITPSHSITLPTHSKYRGPLRPASAKNSTTRPRRGTIIGSRSVTDIPGALLHDEDPQRTWTTSTRRGAAIARALYMRSDIVGLGRSWMTGGRMKRREFIAILGSTAAWPLAVRAQQLKPVIGFLIPTSSDMQSDRLRALRGGLKETGFVEGDNLAIEYRWAEGQYDRLPVLAAELVSHPVAVIVTVGGTPTALAAQSATETIPIIFILGSDPVQIGLVKSLARPGGNITGVTVLDVELIAKGFELLHELIPGATRIGVLVNPKNFLIGAQTRVAEISARNLGVHLLMVNATSQNEIETAFTTLVDQQASGLLVTGDSLFHGTADKLLSALAARHAVPTICQYPQFTAAGGLIGYGPSLADAFRIGGEYAGRILKGAKPADLPVQQPTKIELAINLKTARALGLTIPPTLLARADELIE